MNITWYGQSCFRIQNNQHNVLIDPYSPRQVGLRGPNFKSTITILTNPEDEEVIKKDSKESFLITSPGEYEISGIFVYGTSFIRKDKKLTVYQFEMDNIKFGVLGEINSSLTSEELEGLDGIDVLFIPIGGGTMIDPEKAVEIINSIEPKIIIPCCYQIPKLKIKLSSLEKFLGEMGVKKVEKIPKLALRESNLSSEETKIVVLEPRA